MKLFSQRKGYVSAKDSIQKESMDEDLRIGIWNIMKILLWDSCKVQFIEQDYYFYAFFQQAYLHFFKRPVDTMPGYWNDLYESIRESFFNFKWYEVYDFIEFVIIHYPSHNVEAFIESCNAILEREQSAYRIIGNVVTEITSQEEIEEIETALANSPSEIQTHFNNSLLCLGDKKSPDYRTSIKEAISAVESICRRISGDEKSTLGNALKQIEKNSTVSLHPALRIAFEKLYGYTSDSNGIRHSLIGEDNLSFEDAKFMLVSCSAFVNYLIVKADKAGIKL